MNDPFASFVRKRREELGKTQREVAEACGVTPEMITLIEAGRRHPDLDWVPRLADALETDRNGLCRMALQTWHPNFSAELAGEVIKTEGLQGSDPQNKVTVELDREEADWLRSLKRLNIHARRHLRLLTEQLGSPPVAR